MSYYLVLNTSYFVFFVDKFSIKKTKSSTHNTLVAEELAFLNMLQEEALAAWRRSLTAKKSVEKKSSAKSDKASTKKERTLATEKSGEFGAGDPRFLAQALACSKERRDLLGLDSPKQLRNGEAPGEFDPTKCTAEQLKRIARGEDILSVLAVSHG